MMVEARDHSALISNIAKKWLYIKEKCKNQVKCQVNHINKVYYTDT